MIIFDRNGKHVLSPVTLFLNPTEATELADAASSLASEPTIHHCHVFDTAYETEITVAVHTYKNIHLFDSESRSLLKRRCC